MIKAEQTMVTGKLTATFIYHGHPDYWQGNGDRWDDNKGCLFATYDNTTTLRQLIEGWVDDFNNGGDCDSLPEFVTSEHIKAALLEMLTEKGRKEYEEDKLCEFAQVDDADDIDNEEDKYDELELPIAIVLIVHEQEEE